MQEALAAALRGTGRRWTDPDGGFFLWVTFEPAVDTEALFEVALAEGVAFIPGNAFSPSKRFPDALRLCFAVHAPRTGSARASHGCARAVDRLGSTVMTEFGWHRFATRGGASSS